MIVEQNILSSRKRHSDRSLSKFLRTIAFCVFIIALAVSAFFVADGQFIWKWTRNAYLATLRTPDDALLRFNIGNYYFGGGAYDLDRAEKYFRKVIKLNPNLEGVHYQMARVHFIRGNLYDALAEINKELELYPDYKRSHYIRGLVYGYMEKLDLAAKDFEIFIAWQPQTWAGYNDLAWIYFQQGKYAKAREAAERGLAVFPDNPWLLNSLGVSLLNLGQKEKARAAFERALAVLNSMNPTDWGRAYPGNNPAIYAKGFEAMKASIQSNIQKTKSVDSGNAENGT